MSVAVCVRIRVYFCDRGCAYVCACACVCMCVRACVRGLFSGLCGCAFAHEGACAVPRVPDSCVCARACVDLPARTLVLASVRVLFIFGCVGVRAPMPGCARVCAFVCICGSLSTCVGGCVNAREPALVCAFVHMRARAFPTSLLCFSLGRSARGKSPPR